MRPRTASALGDPSNVMVPLVGRMISRIIRRLVVLPAPFGPRNPCTQPAGTLNERSSTAVNDPYVLVTFRSSRTGAIMRGEAYSRWNRNQSAR